MARIKRGIVVKRKHKKLLERTKGYRATKSRLVKVAKEASLHADSYSYHGRKLRKRDFRSLWITRISEAAKKEGISYSILMNKMKKAKIELNRKILNYLATEDPQTFIQVVEQAKRAGLSN